MAVAGLAMQTISNNVLNDQIFSHLETAAQSRAHHVGRFLEESKKFVEILAKDHHYSDLLLGIAEPSATYGEYNIEHYVDVLNHQIHGELYEIFIVDNGGEIIASTDGSSIDLNKSNDDYFIQGLKGVYIGDAYFFEPAGKNSIAISAPIKHPETGTVLGVIVVRIETTVLDEIVLDKTGLGETGEIYLVNEDGYMITPSRFEQDTFLKKKVDTENVEECFEDFEKYGVEVIW